MAFNALACFGPLAAHIRSGCPALWLISTLSIVLVSDHQPSHHRSAKVLEWIQAAKAETSNEEDDDKVAS